LAITALARISRWNIHSDSSSQRYLDGAERAFANLLLNNTRYDDDHKENILDCRHRDISLRMVKTAFTGMLPTALPGKIMTAAALNSKPKTTGTNGAGQSNGYHTPPGSCRPSQQ
jgi:hypothetical protein